MRLNYPSLRDKREILVQIELVNPSRRKQNLIQMIWLPWEFSQSVRLKSVLFCYVSSFDKSIEHEILPDYCLKIFFHLVFIRYILYEWELLSSKIQDIWILCTLKRTWSRVLVLGAPGKNWTIRNIYRKSSCLKMVLSSSPHIITPTKKYGSRKHKRHLISHKKTRHQLSFKKLPITQHSFKVNPRSSPSGP